MTKLHRLIAVLFFFAATPTLAADYVITVEPNYRPSQAQDIYKPLLDYLSKTTGHRFKLNVSANYHVHWRDLRSAAGTDFAFEEAHFTDFRIDRHGFTPLVRVSEPTRYALLANDAMVSGGVKGLIGYRVVSMPSPSLGYLLLSELYRNPIAQPEIYSVAASWRDGVEMMFSNESEGAMVPSFIADLYPNLSSISLSREFPGRALSASAAVPADVKQAVTNAMLKLHEDSSSYEVLVEIGATQFVPTSAAEYAGNERMLRDVFGYKSKPPSAKPSLDAVPAKIEGVTIEATRSN